MKARPSSSSTPAPVDAQIATRMALLEAAERLFSQKGVEGTSVREIILAAGANLAAINYHFGTKERLALEVFGRRLEPVNRERIARLDALEAAAGRRKLKLEQIVEALVRPAVEAKEENTADCSDFLRLAGRAFQEPNPALKQFVERQFTEVIQRFDAAILRAMPGFPPGELFWRMSFAMGALHHGQERWLRFNQLPRPLGQTPVELDREGLIQRITSFVVAGLSAPLPRVRSAR